MNFLIAEDDATVRSDLQAVLSGLGHHVIICPDRRKAQQIHQRFVFPMLATDGTMPEMSGLDIRQAIGKLDRRRPSSFVITTSGGFRSGPCNSIREE